MITRITANPLLLISTTLGLASTMLTAIIAYIIPLKAIFILVIMTCALDLITGVWASRKAKKLLVPEKLRQSTEKVMCYLLVILLFYHFEQAVGIQHYLATHKLISGFIFITEAFSILKNMAIITKNKIFLKIIDLIQGKAKADKNEGRIINNILNKENNG